MTKYTTVDGSFRDPDGFLYRVGGELYRQVNSQYRPEYDLLVDSGLVANLFEDGLLVKHNEADLNFAATSDAYRVLKSVELPFVSYPFEWSFGQLRAAALLTLTILRRSLDHGMILKDASAYNVQFLGARAVFIDTLSFERYKEGAPWVAYRQFCQHFLAPLALMSHVDVRLAQLYQTNIDGFPLDLTNTLLPLGAKLHPSIAMHITLHARAQRRYSDAGTKRRVPERRVSRMGLQGIVQSLESAIRRLKWRAPETEWGDYSSEASYAGNAISSKRRLLADFLAAVGRRRLALDLGSNKGDFSAIAARHADYVVAMDMDPVAVELHFRLLSSSGREDILPLRMDLTIPSPGIGWRNKERLSLGDRAKDATVIALALIHHLAIGNNVPLPRIADFLSHYAKDLVVEFVPKSDPQVKRLLATRKDIFPHYTQEHFERVFSILFNIRRTESIDNSERTLYLMERRNG